MNDLPGINRVEKEYVIRNLKKNLDRRSNKVYQINLSDDDSKDNNGDSRSDNSIIDLTEAKEEDLLKYNFEDIFKESLDTIKNFSLTPTPTQKDAKNQKEKETKKLSITPRQKLY